MFTRCLLFSLPLLLFTACLPAATASPAPPEPSPTVQPVFPATETSLPATDSPVPPLPTDTEPPPASPLPTDTPTARPILPTLVQPTVTGTIAPQPAAHTGAIQFYKPGPMSRVTSPLSFYGYAVPGHGHKGLMELFGEDGTLLASELLQLNTEYRWAFFSWSLDFRPRGAGELGRLSLSTRDGFGRLTAVGSLHLLLLPMGPEVITPPDSLAERCTLIWPPPGKFISGGKVLVEGGMQAYNGLPLLVDLVAGDGTSLGTGIVPVPAGMAGHRFEFSLEVPYTVRSYTPVLLTVRQMDDRIAGIMYLYSQELNLNP